MLGLVGSAGFLLAEPNTVNELQKRLQDAQEQVETLANLMQELKREMKSQTDEVNTMRERALRLTQASKQNPTAAAEETKQLKARVAELEATVASLRAELTAKDQTQAPQTIAPVYFTASESTLSAEYQRIWAAVQKVLTATPTASFRLTGHANKEGSEELNYRQSAQRAQSLANFLLARGVPAQKLQVVAAGTTHPLHPVDSAAGRKLNRRVVVEVIGK